LLISFGDGAAGTGGGGDDQICRLDMLGQHGGDLGFFFRAQGARIAALAARICAGFDEFRTERQRLILGFRAHVTALDDGAPTVGRGDRLQPRGAEAHHQHLGRADRTRRGGDCGDDTQRRRLNGENHIGLAHQFVAIVDKGDIVERGIAQHDGVRRA
jgi:hypothetical protein